MCIYTDDVCNQKVFQFSLPQFERQNIHNWWKKYIILNTVSLKYILLFCNLVVLYHCDISIHTLVLNILWYMICGAQGEGDS
jgi:hypothetical protein